MDWSQTPLGAAESWPSYLRNAVALTLNARTPIVTLWGEAGTMIYNDGFVGFAQARHPSSLGAPVREAWPEIADFNDNVMRVVLGGGTLSYREQELVVHRNGVAERVWLDLDYSPILDDAGDPAGVLVLVTETTAKVLAERAVTAEQERLRQMFEQAPGFIAMLRGPDHVFELTNAAYVQLIGHRDVIGKSVRSALPDLAGQGFYELLDRVYASGESYLGTAVPALLQRTPDDAPEERLIDFIYQPVRDAAGKVSGIFVEGVDITERIAAERALQASEYQFRTLAEALPNHVWTSPPDGQVDWFNERVYQFSGAGRGDLDGLGWTAIVHPEDRPQAIARWTASLASGENYETEFRLRRADGAWRWHLARAVLLRDARGRPLHWIGTNTDIDDQERMRQQLIDSERRLRLSQQAAGIASLEIDIATDRIFGSDELWDLFGLQRQESAPATDIEKLVLPEDRTLCSSPDTRGNGTAAPDAAYRIRRADTGEIRWIARHMELKHDRTGRPAKMYGALRDITREKVAEERQKMLTHELEHRIKNILATVSAIASQTLRDTDLETGRRALNQRLNALGQAHNLLSNTHWTSVLLEEVVRGATAHLPGEAFSIAGPPVQLGPRRALAMALAVNELCTNSMKYGALSVPEGRVEIAWSRAEDDDGSDTLTWCWRESDGPTVQPPTRTGFGRFLIERVMAADFAGTVRVDFDPDGVACLLQAPWPIPASEAEKLS